MNTEKEILTMQEDTELDVYGDLFNSEEVEETKSNSIVNPEIKAADIADVSVSVDELFSANMHYGYKTKYRNAWMSGYIFKSYNSIDIIDLTKTAVEFNSALKALRRCVAKGGKVLFVGTETHTSSAVRLQAEKCAQYYVHKRWLGGLLTNWRSTSESIMTMKTIDKQLEDGYLKNFRKSEQIKILKRRDRFKKFLDGVKDMGGLPNMMVITSNRERNAIKDALRLKIPVVLLMDTNTNPEGIRYGIPGNDRSAKATDKFVSKCADACLAGLRQEMMAIQSVEEVAESESSTSALKG